MGKKEKSKKEKSKDKIKKKDKKDKPINEEPTTLENEAEDEAIFEECLMYEEEAVEEDRICYCADQECNYAEALETMRRGIVPVLKFEQVQVVSGSMGFTQDCLWTMFNLRKINDALSEMEPGDVRLVKLATPAAPFGAASFCVDFIVSNKTKVQTFCRMRRRRTCACARTEKCVGLGHYVKGYDECPHRPLLQLKPVKYDFLENETKTLHMEVQYVLEGKHIMAYDISLSDDRILQLEFSIAVIATDEPPSALPLAPCPESDNFVNSDLHPVCLCDPSPPLQTLWLYNPYGEDVEYCVEIIKHHNALFAINECGVVPAFGVLGVLVLFKPFQFKIYEFVLTVTSGEQSHLWRVRGQAMLVRTSLYPPFPALKKSPHAQYPTAQCAVLSHVRIVLVCISHSQQEALVHLQNMSDKCVAFDWDECLIHGLLVIKVVPTRGLLPPGRTLTMRAVALSKGPACVMTVPLNCKVTMPQPPVLWNMEGFFTIMESGYYEPTPPEPPEIPVYTLTLCVYIRVLNCCSSLQGLLICREPQCLPGLNTNMPALPRPKTCPPCKSKEGPTETEILRGKHDIEIVCSILDRIIWDVVKCRVFKSCLINMQQECIPYYSQLKTRKESEISKPKLPVMSSTIQELLYDSIHEAMKLSKLPENASIKPLPAPAIPESESAETI